MTTPHYALIGAASDFGGIMRGASLGPQVLRQHGLARVFSELGLPCTDLGDISPASAVQASAPMSPAEMGCLFPVETFTACRLIKERVAQALNSQMFPIVIGGDHSLAMGSIAAVSDHFALSGKKIGVIWIDAHVDINTPDTTVSRAFFGMPVSYLLGLASGGFSALQNNTPAVRKENFVYVGSRNIDPDEKRILKDNGIRAFTMKEIDVLGMHAVAQRAIEIAGKGTDGFVVSFDLDACDPYLVPGTGTPWRGGISFREAHLLLETIYESKKMVSFELVEFNPTRDNCGQTAELAISLVESAVGKTIL